MMKALLLTIFVAIAGSLYAQHVPVEVTFGNRNYWYQHLISRKFSPESKFGFFHVSSLYVFYEDKIGEELMSQSYVTYQVVEGIALAGGAFYSTGPGFSPSFGIQFSKRSNDLFFIIIPRVDVKKSGSYEVMTLLEYTPRITDRLRLYSRIQGMSNYTGSDHNKSYQNLRVGVEIKQFQFGLAMNLDEYGDDARTYWNNGIFLRTKI
jgi:hypothetical protein